MSMRYKGGVISATPPTTSASSAPGIWTLEQQLQAKVGSGWPDIPSGQQEYTTAGTYSWTAPAGVGSVCVVCVGGGGGGGDGSGDYGGGGGGLGYKNNISVIPGNTYTVVVGAGGLGFTGVPTSSRNGGDSYFINISTVCGYGGSSTGGSYVGDGGGSGGNPATVGAGSGAGGYSGSGGGNVGGVAGSGGGGGSGSYSGLVGNGAGGGGVGLLGQGSNGSAGSPANSVAYNEFMGGGGGGSGGSSGGSTYSVAGFPYTPTNGAAGGLYGGGGGCSFDITGANGANGAVRIIWGRNRSFPSTNTGNV